MSDPRELTRDELTNLLKPHRDCVEGNLPCPEMRAYTQALALLDEREKNTKTQAAAAALVKDAGERYQAERQAHAALRERIEAVAHKVGAKAAEIEAARVDWTDDRVSHVLRNIEHGLSALLTTPTTTEGTHDGE